MTTAQAESGNATDFFARKVKKEIEKLRNPKKNLAQNIGVLLLTLFLFASLGLFTSSISGIIVFIVVLFVHEAGHFIGMKFFGYRDVQMFFIPLLGAAVSGVESNPSSVRKAIVSLLGPIPGIVIGIICAIIFFKTNQAAFAVCASTFLFINALNLLPFHPLDGGRFFDYLLFSRNPKIEIVFKIITCLALGGLAYFLRAYFIGIFAVFVLASLRMTFVASNVAHELKNVIKPEELAHENMPDIYLAGVVDQLRKKLTIHDNNEKLIAKYVMDIWQRVRNKPAKIGATLGLVSIYVPFLLIGVVSPFIFEAAKMYGETRTEIVERINDEGESVSAEVSYYHDKKVSDIPINNKGLYHGLQTTWYLQVDQISKQGTWENGYWHGEWKFWDQEGNIESIVEYEMGKAIRYSIVESGRIKALPKDEWPFAIKKANQSSPEGPKDNS